MIHMMLNTTLAKTDTIVLMMHATTWTTNLTAVNLSLVKTRAVTIIKTAKMDFIVKKSTTSSVTTGVGHGPVRSRFVMMIMNVRTSIYNSAVKIIVLKALTRMQNAAEVKHNMALNYFIHREPTKY